MLFVPDRYVPPSPPVESATGCRRNEGTEIDARSGYAASGGFALVASLLLLIVLTLLGVSALNMIGLQERMASNLKEKERATEAAEIANRGAELFLADYPPPGVLEEIPVAGSPGPTGVWELGGPIGGAGKPAKDFAADTNWAAAAEFGAPPFDDNALVGTGATNLYVAKPQSYTEEFLLQPYTLNPDDLATGAGLFYYRVTGRGFGGNDTAVSVVQSIYLQRFK